MVLAASGVEHDTLVSVVEPLLSDLPSVKRPEEPKSVYVGGDYRCQADSPVSCWHCSIVMIYNLLPCCLKLDFMETEHTYCTCF